MQDSRMAHAHECAEGAVVTDQSRRFAFIRSCSRDSARVGLVRIISGLFVLVGEKFVALSNKRSSSSLISNARPLGRTRCAFVKQYWSIDWQSEIAKMTIITKAITEKKASDKMEQPLFVEENATVSMLHGDERDARLIAQLGFRPSVNQFPRRKNATSDLEIAKAAPRNCPARLRANGRLYCRPIVNSRVSMYTLPRSALPRASGHARARQCWHVTGYVCT